MNCSEVTTNVTVNSDGDEELHLECDTCLEGFLFDGLNSESLCIVLQPFQKEIDTPEAQKDICELRNPSNGLCLLCPSPSIFDSDFANCVSVPTGIPNCQVYLTEAICSSCRSGFHLSQNQCVAVSSTVDNCLWYSSESTCKVCLGGFQLKVQDVSTDPNNPQIVTTCEAKPVANCLSYDDSTGMCKECEANFYLRRENVPSEATESGEDLSQSVLDLAKTVSQANAFDFSQKHFYSCKEKVVDNCSNYVDNISTFYKPADLNENGKKYFEMSDFPLFVFEDQTFLSESLCEDCHSNFFLKDNSCHPVSADNQIENCFEYLSGNECKKCLQNFILTKEK